MGEIFYIGWGGGAFPKEMAGDTFMEWAFSQKERRQLVADLVLFYKIVNQIVGNTVLL